MAVRPDFPGLEVEVVVRKKALVEHNDLDICEDAKTTTRYIEAPSGAEFCMQYTFSETFPVDRPVSMHMFVDGMMVIRTTLKTEKLRNTYCVRECLTVLDGVQRAQKMRFADLEITDNSDAVVSQLHLGNLDSLGEIKVMFAFSEVLGHTTRVSKPRHVAVFDKVPETTLKGAAKSLQLSLGDKRVVTMPSRLLVKEMETFAVFVFKYRSRGTAKIRTVRIQTSKHSTSFLKILPQHQVHRVTPPTPAPASETVNKLETEGSRLSPLQQSSASTPTSVSQQQSQVSTRHAHVEGLDVEEIIAMIAVYRGRVDGLAGQSKKSLLGLLRYYESNDQESPTVEIKPPPGTSRAVNVKRERVDDASVISNQKRTKQEIVVLDD